jgi:hypothetical protein
MFSKKVLGVAGATAFSVFGFIACSDDTPANNNNATFNPGGNGDAGQQNNNVNDNNNHQTDGDGGTCPNNPPNCFCGTPTTQAQFLNRCTTSKGVAVNLTVKPATTADIK